MAGAYAQMTNCHARISYVFVAFPALMAFPITLTSPTAILTYIFHARTFFTKVLWSFSGLLRSLSPTHPHHPWCIRSSTSFFSG
jgi:hypothetical protein